MSSNRLRLNRDKTQFIWLGTAPQLAKVNNRTITLADAVIEVSDAVTCLGVVTDSQLSFANHVKKLPVSCFYQLRQLRTVRRSLTTDAAKTLVHALISSCVDYCNNVLYRICEVHLHPCTTPVSILIAAARLVAGKRKFDHITAWHHVRRATLASGSTTHPVQTVISKCLGRSATDMCIPVSMTTVGRSRLRSCSRRDLRIPRCRLS